MISIGGELNVSSQSFEQQNGDERRITLQDIYWYQVTESLDSQDILCAKWTATLLLGTIHSSAIIIKVLKIRSHFTLNIPIIFLFYLGKRFI